jgi:hypothetical protein
MAKLKTVQKRPYNKQSRGSVLAETYGEKRLPTVRKPKIKAASKSEAAASSALTPAGDDSATARKSYRFRGRKRLFAAFRNADVSEREGQPASGNPRKRSAAVQAGKREGKRRRHSVPALDEGESSSIKRVVSTPDKKPMRKVSPTADDGPNRKVAPTADGKSSRKVGAITDAKLKEAASTLASEAVTGVEQTVDSEYIRPLLDAFPGGREGACPNKRRLSRKLFSGARQEQTRAALRHQECVEMFAVRQVFKPLFFRSSVFRTVLRSRIRIRDAEILQDG